jgi:predicted nucleic acid-binding protein
MRIVADTNVIVSALVFRLRSALATDTRFQEFPRRYDGYGFLLT